MNCKPCPYWNKGKGTPSECLFCSQFKDKNIFKDKEMPRQGASSRAIRLDKEHLENLDNPDNPLLKDIFEKLPLVSPEYAVPLLMNTLLKMKPHEIADYHNKSRWNIRCRIKKALEEIRELL